MSIAWKFFPTATSGSQLSFAIDNIPHGAVSLSIVIRSDAEDTASAPEREYAIYTDDNFMPASHYVKLCFDKTITIPANRYVVILSNPNLYVNSNSIALSEKCDMYEGFWISFFFILIIILLVAIILFSISEPDARPPPPPPKRALPQQQQKRTTVKP